MKDISSRLFLVSIVIAIFGVVFYFSNLPSDSFFIALKGVLVVVLIDTLIFLTHRKNQTKQALQQEIEIEEYQKALQKSEQNQREMSSYLLLWIHQMKTPITAMKVILDGRATDSDTLQMKMQMTAIEDYAQMTINYLKMLDESADMTIAAVSFDQLVRPLAKKYTPFFINKKIQLELNALDNTIFTDAKWAGILIDQIFSNAIKYTKNGKITISGKENQLIIQDTGIGIREEDLPKIFDRGYSGFNGSLNEKSTGIGLYLASRISKKLSTDIAVQSTLDVGTTVTITFPKEHIWND